MTEEVDLLKTRLQNLINSGQLKPDEVIAAMQAIAITDLASAVTKMAEDVAIIRRLVESKLEDET